jgi:hypothetical protein
MSEQPPNTRPNPAPDTDQPRRADSDDGLDHPPPEDAEQIRSASQTAQDRDHTIRGGDNRTAITKEFPT